LASDKTGESNNVFSDVSFLKFETLNLAKGKEMTMPEDMVKCPRDSKVMYSRDVCENIFRKNDIRVWCKTCEVFSHDHEADRSQASAT
jgi:hypothetical protein